MEDRQSMTVADVSENERDNRFKDFVRKSVVLIARELMEKEIRDEIDEEIDEIATEKTLTNRKG